MHKDYGEVIKQLTDDLEEEQDKNKKLTIKQKELKSEIKKLNNELIKVKSTVGNTGSAYSNDLNNSSATNSDSSICPNCGVEVEEGYAFCDSCGTKL